MFHEKLLAETLPLCILIAVEDVKSVAILIYQYFYYN